MNELFKKIINGTYHKIPSKYSSDLSTVIASLLQVSSDKRPTCQQLLKNHRLQKYIEDVDKQIKID